MKEIGGSGGAGGWLAMPEGMRIVAVRAGFGAVDATDPGRTIMHGQNIPSAPRRRNPRA